jgi:hypothetical protein
LSIGKPISPSPDITCFFTKGDNSKTF